MGEICNDLKWNDQREIKTFLLEHQMASIREGFKELYASLNTDKLASGLRDGTLPELNIFTKHIAPILQARSENNHQLVMNLLQNYNSNYFKENPSINTLKNISMLIESMFSAYQDNSNITFLEILRIIGQSSIFEIPNRLKDIMILSKGQKIANIISNIEEDKESDKITLGLAKFLNTPFKQAYSYQKYINEETSYTTHHNVKGLEFPRVILILDDDDKRGRGGLSASYEKLFGVLPPSDRDKSNKRDGIETDIDRTRRLFYVTCTRAESSLAVVAYTKNPELFKENAIRMGYFYNDEITIL